LERGKYEKGKKKREGGDMKKGRKRKDKRGKTKGRKGARGEIFKVSREQEKKSAFSP
jgi:hypothetical protein